MKTLFAVTLVLLAVGAALVTRAANVDAPSTKAANRQQTIAIDNFTFNSKSVTVPPGTKVTWINHDDVPHKVVSADKTFSSPVLDTDGRFSFTFTKPGTYDYFCSIHPMMTGNVVVK